MTYYLMETLRDPFILCLNDGVAQVNDNNLKEFVIEPIFRNAMLPFSAFMKDGIVIYTCECLEVMITFIEDNCTEFLL